MLTIGATFVLLQHTQTMSHLVEAAADITIGELRELALSPVLHAGAAAAVLLGANVLSGQPGIDADTGTSVVVHLLAARHLGFILGLRDLVTDQELVL